MIVYFSATGNCRYVARQIAESLNDDAISLLDIAEINLSDGETLGFVFPTYFWGLPSIVNELLSKLTISKSGDNYVFHIATYGTTSGQNAEYVERHLKNKGIVLDAKFAVKMPDTWTPTYDLSNHEEVLKLNQDEKPQIEEIINHVNNRDNGDFIKSHIPMIVCKFAQVIYDKRRNTSHLHVEDTCIECGLCSKNCPIEAIAITDKKPVWVKDKCVMCLKCLHHCPKFSIQYDDRTKNHGQYHHPKKI
ncbi:MAG: EFR1 family ferrodoxin [Methanobrevibacter sp.]|uniref:EFR1 family ferrodoxin n=1 Tax=Methanobrevibacter sp. TaxID=66852 RepID=UPI0025ED21FD|nr:EFR1 family ferrodoxin [Methanobrevibacter sp.]MBR0271757.1 EFR1 family ferrodoxin [Methanobrevibacter sp.]